MLPREHGAYGQLIFPMATALAVGHPTSAWLALALAAALAFLAHEPLLVLLGQRGVRVARDERARAWRWFAPLVAGAAASGLMGLTLLPPDARVLLVAPSLLALALGAAILAGRERTTAGEILTALALASFAQPLARAAGASAVAALTCAAVFAVAFTAGTVSVRSVIMSTRRPPAAAFRAGAGAAIVAGFIAVAWLSSRGALAGTGVLAAVPMCGAGLALVARPPSAARLRVVGWTLIGATAATALVLVAGLRLVD